MPLPPPLCRLSTPILPNFRSVDIVRGGPPLVAASVAGNVHSNRLVIMIALVEAALVYILRIHWADSVIVAFDLLSIVMIFDS